ncbi:MAG: ribosome small subunit-dependent GTPase A [Acidimicrobiales bacterium]
MTEPLLHRAGEPPEHLPQSHPYRRQTVDGVPGSGSAFASLADLGWDDGYASALVALAAAKPEHSGETVGGRVLRRDKTACQVALGGSEAHCPILPALLGDPLTAPTTGDFVGVRGGEIVAVLERRTSVMRGAFRNLTAQVLAANVEYVMVAVPLSSKFRPRRLERLLVVAWQTGAVPLVVITKLDCSGDAAEAYSRAKALSPGATVHMVSAFTGEGVEELAAELSPRTTSVIIGPSGAGKSTLANALGDSATELATAEIRGDGKGRHTTVARELVRLANGAMMIDTPGLRAIGLWDAEEALSEAFGDVEALAVHCRFNDCAHASEPDCAVSAAVDSGELDADRLSSYQKLQREQRRLAARTDAKLRAERTAESKAFNKQNRRMPHH